MKYYVCIDIGGTEIKHCVLQESEEGRGRADFIEKGKMPTEAVMGGSFILDKAVSIVQAYRENYEIAGICVSTAGMVDTLKGEIFYAAPLIPNYTGTGIKKRMEEEFHIPCEVENDVNCAGLSEGISGAAKGAKSALCLTVGTGIGGCLLMDGKVYHGFSGSACEVGYMRMRDNDFQTLGAASILVQKAAHRKGEPLEKWDGYRVFEEAKKEDKDCIAIIDEMCDILGEGIANICYVFNPQVVVLGGGIMAQKEYLKGRIEKALSQYLVSSIYERTTLTFAAHKNDAGMLGAYYHYKGMQDK